jgi:glutamate mutase epsilon subunit
MTDEQINIAIAEACGWTSICYNSIHGKWMGTQPQEDRDAYHLPDYCNCLNAMHEAEKVFDTALYCRYINELCDLTIKGNNSMYMATARQRAEAFLKTIEKWNSDKI